MSNLRLRAAILAAFPLVGCSSLGFPDTVDLPLPVHSRSHLERDGGSELLLFASNDPASAAAHRTVLEAVRTAHGGDAGKANQAIDVISATCVRDQPTADAGRGRLGIQRFSPATALAAPLASALITAGAAALQREISRWASSYESSWSTRRVDEFYAAPPQTVASAELRHPCYAVIRRAAGPRDTTAPLFLHVGQFVPATDRIALRLDPILHAHTGTQARVGSGGSFRSAMVVTMESVWIDQRRGVTATRDAAFVTTLNFGMRNLNAPAPTLFATAEQRRAAGSGWLPYVPVSVIDGRAVGTGPVNITMTVAETAKARDLAQAIAGQANDLVGQLAARLREEIEGNR